MDRRRIMNWALALGLVGVFSPNVLADKITFTGDVEKDFVKSATNNVTIFPGNPRDGVGQADFINQEGWVTGWNMKDLRVAYDTATDVLQVGVNFWGIAGDVDGNGDPGVADPRTLAVGGLDLPNLGGRKSISVAFAADAPNSKTAPGPGIVVAGVPYDKSMAGTGIDGFTVSTYKESNQGIFLNYGQSLANAGELAFDPSKDHPDFEFTIKNFRQIPGLDPENGFWVQAFAGSPDGIVSGENTIGWLRVPKGVAQQVPEPTTVLAWTMMAGGAAVALRRSRRRADSV